MSARPTFAKGLMAVAATATALTGFMAAPTAASAQDYPPPGYNQCQASTTNGQVGGALLGGLAGAVLGSNIARGGGRTGGAVIGGVAGAAVGSSIGGSTAANNCAQYGGPPPPPGSGPAYYDNGGPPPPPPPPQCGPAETRIHYPDGSVQSFRSRACRDPYNGVWHIVQ